MTGRRVLALIAGVVLATGIVTSADAAKKKCPKLCKSAIEECKASLGSCAGLTGKERKACNKTLNKGKKGQATLLTDTYKYFAKARNKYNVQAVDWFSWQDQQTSICSWCASSGLLTTTGAAKPSLKAFVKLTGGSAGKR